MSDHEHVWDTETDEFSTFTPDPGLDDPWVIHECVVGRCRALKITRPLFGADEDSPATLIYEIASVAAARSTHTEETRRA